jgi:hypothetical protein
MQSRSTKKHVRARANSRQHRVLEVVVAVITLAAVEAVAYLANSLERSTVQLVVRRHRAAQSLNGTYQRDRDSRGPFQAMQHDQLLAVVPVHRQQSF